MLHDFFKKKFPIVSAISNENIDKVRGYIISNRDMVTSIAITIKHCDVEAFLNDFGIPVTDKLRDILENSYGDWSIDLDSIEGGVLRFYAFGEQVKNTKVFDFPDRSTDELKTFCFGFMYFIDEDEFLEYKSYYLHSDKTVGYQYKYNAEGVESPRNVEYFPSYPNDNYEDTLNIIPELDKLGAKYMISYRPDQLRTYLHVR